jgi:hypothetical protein
MEEHKQALWRVSECSCRKTAMKEWTCLQRIVTNNSTRVCHCEPCCTQQSMECKHPTSLKTEQFKSQATGGKVIQLFIWQSSGPILKHYLEQGTTVTAASYTEILKSKLKPAIRKKRSCFLSKGILLLREDTCPHSATATVEATRKLASELVPRAPPPPPHITVTQLHRIITC